MIRDNIVKALIKSTDLEDITIDSPEIEDHGDYSTNIALVASKKENKNPRDLANEIVEKLKADKDLKDIVEKIDVAGPGFINFYLSKKYLIKNLSEIGEGYGIIKQESPRKIIIEFTDPNPFKEFHIGHLYSNSVGESICRILEAAGNEVKRANYQGDVGLHVAKSIWGMLEKFKEENTSLDELSDKSLQERIKFMGQAYALGATSYKEGHTEKEINDLNKKIFELDSSIKNIYMTGRKWSLEYFETIYKRLGTKFDFYYFESEIGKVGLGIVKEFLKKGVFEESKGAVVFPGEKYGLHTRVFINSMGLPTYEAKELGLAPMKYKDFKYDQSIIITGNEIDEYFKVLIEAIKKTNPDLGNKTMHLSHGMVRLPEGKMSSRTGKILTGEWLLDEAKKSILEKHKMDSETAEKVAVAAVKYALLKSSVGQDIIFNFEESISIEGNSGPYIQYTIARANSIASKKRLGNKIEVSNKLNHEELLLLKQLSKYPDIVEKAAKNYSPSTVSTYIHMLAQCFNTFYNLHKVVGSDNEDIRLLITKSTATVLKSGLDLLGIKSPEKM